MLPIMSLDQDDVPLVSEVAEVWVVGGMGKLFKQMEQHEKRLRGSSSCLCLFFDLLTFFGPPYSDFFPKQVVSLALSSLREER